jgi:integrase
MPAMPKLRHGQNPSLRRHAAAKQGVVRLNGHDHYLGPWPAVSKEPPQPVRDAYDRLIALWVANGRRPIDPAGDGPTVAEVVVAFLEWAATHYHDLDGNPTGAEQALRFALRPLVRLFPNEPAAAFGPLKLKAVRRAMVEAGHARSHVNAQVGKVKRVFKWAVAEELVPPAVYQALSAVAGLQQGRGGARERGPVLPVPPEHVDKTLPFLTPAVAGLVQFQRLTGCRPGEACRLRGEFIERPRVVGLRRVTAPDGAAQNGEVIDRPGPLWHYRPARHKTAHKGKGRVIPIGPKAQQLLAPFLLAAGPDGYLFGPRRAVRDLRARQRAARKTKVQPSQADRSKPNPQRPPSEHYGRHSYEAAVRRACVRAALADLAERRPDLLVPVREAEAALKATRAAVRKAAKDKAAKDVRAALTTEARRAAGAYRQAVAAASEAGDSVRHWHPNQLRHLHATEVRRRYGLEGAQVALGHAKADVTQVYAERDLALAERIAREVG